MDGVGKDMNCVARRTRRKWDDYYEKCYIELKRENRKSDGVDKRVKKYSEPAGADEGKQDFVVSCEKGCDDDDDDDDDDEEEDDDVGILQIDEDEFHGVEILKSREDVSKDGGGILKNGEDGGAGILKKGEAEDDDGDEMLEREEDGGEMLERDEEGGAGILGRDESEDDGGGEMLERDEEGGGGILEKDEAEDDDDGIELLREEDDDVGFESLKNDEDQANGIEMLQSSEEEDAEEEENAQSKAEDVEQIHELISVSSDTEDSDECVDFQVSESESESESESSSDEDMDELSDAVSGDEQENNGENESSVKEILVDSRKESNKKPVKDDNNSDDDDDDEQESDDAVIFNDKKKMKPPMIRKSRRLNPFDYKRVDSRKESDKKPEKDDDDDDQQESDDAVIFHDKKKMKPPIIRKSRRLNPEKENGGELERGEKQITSKKRKRDDDRELEHEECSSPATTMEAEQESLNDVKKFFSTGVVKPKFEEAIFTSKKPHSARDLDLIKILVDSLNSVKQKQYSIDEKALAENTLPLKFKFEEEEVAPPPEKSDWEKHIDSLFCDMELGLREAEGEAEADCSGFSKIGNEEDKTSEKIVESQAVLCRRGNHQAVLDEEIGIVCEFCQTVIMDIKHILPPFRTPAPNRRNRKAYHHDESPRSFFDDIQLQESATSAADASDCTSGTVWDLIPGVRKELYPHQREGFEFIWKNIAGGIILEQLKHTLEDDAKGCIISHAPGTGKTRLTIVFLQTFMKLYPTCCPMIVAPVVMLQTWENEFKKWNFNIAFHNLNKNELSGKENAVAAGLVGQVGSGALSRDCLRLLKLYSWATGGSVLGVSYALFEKLAGGNGRRNQHEKIREVLLERPGLLVLDEGHTPRNQKSKIWKVLTKVSTRRRIILSGTPFQNSLQELCNTICVANPKFVNQVGLWRYRRLTNSSDANRDEAMKLKAFLAPFIHVHKGTILKESLPGLRHTLVFLHPTECQKILLKHAWEERNFLRRNRMISLISVHPSIDVETEGYPTDKSKKEETNLDLDAGVKTRFLMKLIHLSDALGERVLVFSQFIDSLLFIKNQLVSNFSWNEEREVLYMDGQLDDKRRQEAIASFNDDASEAKVLLASVKACSEGINLTGASRVVLLDTLWNPSVEKQAICRAYRIGQRKVVHVYRLFTTGVEIRLGQLPCQLQKEQVSRWLFSLGEEQGCLSDESAVSDKVLDAMVGLDEFRDVFDKVLSQPNESELMETFGLSE